MARAWAKGVGHTADCGRKWFHGFVKRATAYRSDFGESKRSKIDVMRAQKQNPIVIGKFFDMLEKTCAHHKELGHFEGDEPAPEDVYCLKKIL